jgi:predicted nucleotidyltransferase
VLNLLADTLTASYTIRDLHRATDHSLDNVRQAVTALEELDLATMTPEGNSKLVSINGERLQAPANPVAGIPQTESHDPVSEAVSRLQDALDGVRGIVLFGSVADSTADRRSDIDLFVLVETTQGANQQTAHEVASELSEQRFDGDRYEFQVLVESVETATNYGERLREILIEGITLVETDSLRELRQEVLEDGR